MSLISWNLEATWKDRRYVFVFIPKFLGGSSTLSILARLHIIGAQAHSPTLFELCFYFWPLFENLANLHRVLVCCSRMLFTSSRKKRFSSMVYIEAVSNLNDLLFFYGKTVINEEITRRNPQWLQAFYGMPHAFDLDCSYYLAMCLLFTQQY